MFNIDFCNYAIKNITKIVVDFRFQDRIFELQFNIFKVKIIL